MEYRLRHKDGYYVWVLDSGRVFRDQSGAILRQTGVIIDISARKKIAESLSRQTDLIELSFEPIFVWHPEKGIVDWNRGAEQLYGFTRAEALGQASHKLLRTTHPIDPADLMTLLNTVRSWTGELQQRAKDGRRIFVESRHQAIEADGEILILETNHDITERKRAEADTARMAAVAAASQPSKVTSRPGIRPPKNCLATPLPKQSDSTSTSSQDPQSMGIRATTWPVPVPAKKSNPIMPAGCERTDPTSTCQ
jgi:PAS domain S-box-containing protein